MTDFKVDAVNWKSETVFSTIAEPESCPSKSSGIGGIQCRRKEIKSLEELWFGGMNTEKEAVSLRISLAVNWETGGSLLGDWSQLIGRLEAVNWETGGS